MPYNGERRNKMSTPNNTPVVTPAAVVTPVVKKISYNDFLSGLPELAEAVKRAITSTVIGKDTGEYVEKVVVWIDKLDALDFDVNSTGIVLSEITGLNGSALKHPLSDKVLSFGDIRTAAREIKTALDNMYAAYSLIEKPAAIALGKGNDDSALVAKLGNMFAKKSVAVEPTK